jgi:hypothetical protein
MGLKDVLNYYGIGGRKNGILLKATSTQITVGNKMCPTKKPLKNSPSAWIFKANHYTRKKSSFDKSVTPKGVAD